MKKITVIKQELGKGFDIPTNLRRVHSRLMDEGNYKILKNRKIISLKGNHKVIVPYIKPCGSEVYKLWNKGKRSGYHMDTLMNKYFPEIKASVELKIIEQEISKLKIKRNKLLKIIKEQVKQE